MRIVLKLTGQEQATLDKDAFLAQMHASAHSNIISLICPIVPERLGHYYDTATVLEWRRLCKLPNSSYSGE
jgi:hypothetical protein